MTAECFFTFFLSYYCSVAGNGILSNNNVLEVRNCYMIMPTALTMDIVKHTFSTIMMLYSCSDEIFDVVEG